MCNTGSLRKTIRVAALLFAIVVLVLQRPTAPAVSDIAGMFMEYPVLSPVIAFVISSFQSAIPIFPLFIVAGANAVVFGPTVGFFIS